MPKANINWIINLNTERREKVKPLLLELRTAMADDALPLEYRQRRERELRVQIAGINDGYAKRIGEATKEAMEDPQRKWAERSGLKAEQLAEVPLFVEQYRGKTLIEQRQLVAEIAADLDAGATSRALVKARAAATLGVPLGPVESRLAEADPVMRDAKHAMDALRLLAELAGAEPMRELAMAGLANARERLALNNFAAERGLRPDAGFTDQVQPGYSGPTVERDGFPNAPFPEPHDPERDRQRRDSERHRDRAAADQWMADERRWGGLASPPPERHEAEPAAVEQPPSPAPVTGKRARGNRGEPG